MREASQWIDRYRAFWDARLDRLGDYLRETQPQEQTATPTAPPTRPGSRQRRRKPKESR